LQLQTREQVEQAEQLERQARGVENMSFQHPSPEEALVGVEEEAEVRAGASTVTAPKAVPFTRAMDKIGRNDPCPCGSGKKYKQCHGRLA
jgi:preprotein translocase subunit SecA